MSACILCLVKNVYPQPVFSFLSKYNVINASNKGTNQCTKFQLNRSGCAIFIDLLSILVRQGYIQ
jgi:hypothetical protein